MKKVMDKLFNNIKFDKKYIFFSLVIVLLGIITGSLFIVILKSTDKSLVVEYIETFIEKIKNNSINYIDVLKNVLIINYIVLLIISIVGFTYFLFPINILVLFYKSFVVGFSLGSFILSFKLKGLLLSIIYIFPHLVINLLLFAALVAYTLKLSLSMIKYIIKKKEVNMRAYFNKYLYTVLFILVMITITSLYEAFISTFLLKSIANFII